MTAIIKQGDTIKAIDAAKSGVVLTKIPVVHGLIQNGSVKVGNYGQLNFMKILTPFR
jgi:hypothetical protein